NNGIQQIMLRSRPESGPYQAKPEAYKMEAVLQLLPLVRVTPLSTLSIGSWVNREAPVLPEPSNEKMLPRQAKQQAIQTAAFALMHFGDERYFQRKP
ncbi:MAG: DUF3010 family protein, partial [Verrucomicrobiaceae bacterium]